MPVKSLMMIDDPTMAHLHAGPSAGLNFHIVESPDGLVVVSQSGEAMPLFDHPDCFCLSDVLNGATLPKPKPCHMR